MMIWECVSKRIPIFFVYFFLLVILFFRIFANVKMQFLSTKNF